MKIVNFVWWLCFVLGALIAQKLFPGFDFLIVGFILLLQEEDLMQLAIVTPFLLLIQESISTFSFGTVLLWYVIAIVLTVLAKWLFQTRTFFFILTFSLLLSFSQTVVYFIMQGLDGTESQLADHYLEFRIIQALIIALTYKLAIITRPKVVEATFTNT